MIISASYRTDIPAFYGEWFLERLGAGSVRVKNPYGGPETVVSLRREDVDGFVFWTRNAGPFLDALAEVGRRGDPFVVQYTINGYPSQLDERVPTAEHSIATVRQIAVEYGPRVVVWRYDPVVLTSLTPAEFHRRNFEQLARELEGVTDEVVISFAQIYRKTRRNMDRAAVTAGFTWGDPPEEEKAALAREMAGCARAFGMRLTVCTQPEFTGGGIGEARCIDVERLASIAGRPVAAKLKGNRPGCGCFESRDIGAYDTCPHGCVYCYAVRDREAALRNYQRHAVNGERLVTVRRTDSQSGR